MKRLKTGLAVAVLLTSTSVCCDAVWGQSVRVTTSVKTSIASAKKRVSWEETIEHVLDSPADSVYDETPLFALVEELREVHEIPVYVDALALREADYDDGLPLTGDGGGRSVRAALKTLFHEHGLCFVVKDESLWITTKWALADHPKTFHVVRSYDVTDLVAGDPAPLVDAIKGAVNPEAWEGDDRDGGTIESVDLRGRTVLVVAQHSECQRDIANFLETLRSSNLKESSPSPSGGAKAKNVRTGRDVRRSEKQRSFSMGLGIGN